MGGSGTGGLGAGGWGRGRGVEGEGPGDISSTLPCTAPPHGASHNKNSKFPHIWNGPRPSVSPKTRITMHLQGRD